MRPFHYLNQLIAKWKGESASDKVYFDMDRKVMMCTKHRLPTFSVYGKLGCIKCFQHDGKYVKKERFGNMVRELARKKNLLEKSNAVECKIHTGVIYPKEMKVCPMCANIIRRYGKAK